MYLFKDGIGTNPKRTQAINVLTLPNSKRAMQYFMGKINFARQFVVNFFEIVKPLQDLVKKYVIFKWGEPQKITFGIIK